MTEKIFLSYRRDDSRGYTTAICTLLELHFGSGQIFMDVDTLLPGTDFVQSLENAVEGCDIFLAIIGPSWEDIRDDNGARRLDNPDDFVRIEVAHALRRGIPVIPVLVGGAQMPSSKKLPENIKNLSRRHAFSIGDHLRSDVQQLVKVLEKTFERLEKEQIEQQQNEQGQLARQYSAVGKKVQEDQDRLKLQKHEEKGRINQERIGRTANISSLDKKKPSTNANVSALTSFIKGMPIWGWGIGILVIALIGYGVFGRFPSIISAAPSETASVAPVVVIKSPTQSPLLSTATSSPVPSTPTQNPTVTSSVTPSEVPTMEPVSGVEVTNPVDGSVMVYVPSGDFIMGSETGDADEQPVHIVYLDGFWIGKTEVTNAMYRLCVVAGYCDEPEQDKFFNNYTYASHPIVDVGWTNAINYCRWADSRLPTEAEWEKAARGIDGRTFPWGEGFNPALANYDSSGTTPVDEYPDGESPYGVLGMAGNVWEWVADWYGTDYYSKSPTENPTGPDSGFMRVMRGGAFTQDGAGIRSTNRSMNRIEDHNFYTGFRCASSQRP